MFNWPNLSAPAVLNDRLDTVQTRGLAPALLTTAIASVWALPVAAQQSQPIEEVVVTGYRQSILSAIDAKRMGDTVSETLSADDLGSLPDVSMADALTRLPGISAVRTGGQAGEINIRGMSGGFVFTTLNGTGTGDVVTILSSGVRWDGTDQKAHLQVRGISGPSSAGLLEEHEWVPIPRRLFPVATASRHPRSRRTSSTSLTPG